MKALEVLNELIFDVLSDEEPTLSVVEVAEKFAIIKQALLRLKSLEKFKATYDKYELAKKQDYVAFEIMEEVIKREEEMKAKVKRYLELNHLGFLSNSKEVEEFMKLFHELKEWSESNE